MYSRMQLTHYNYRATSAVTNGSFKFDRFIKTDLLNLVVRTFYNRYGDAIYFAL